MDAVSDIVPVKCLSCGARVSGVRTEFGSLVVPGHEGCPRCGSGDLSEVTDDAESEGDPGTETRTTD